MCECNILPHACHTTAVHIWTKQSLHQTQDSTGLTQTESTRLNWPIHRLEMFS